MCTDLVAGLYPLLSCFLNLTGGILDLHTVLDPVWTEEVCLRLIFLFSVKFLTFVRIELEIGHSW